MKDNVERVLSDIQDCPKFEGVNERPFAPALLSLRSIRDSRRILFFEPDIQAGSAN